jgi:hypothetical protein
MKMVLERRQRSWTPLDEQLVRYVAKTAPTTE